MSERQDTPPVAAPEGAATGETTFTDAEAPGAAPPAAAPRGAAAGASTPGPAAPAEDGARAEPLEGEGAGAPAVAPVEPGVPSGQPAADAQATTPPPAAAGGEDAIAALRRERDEYLALAQRKQAEFENFRKRMTRENATSADRGVARLATELLGALDHLELALRAAQAEGGTLYDGVRMVQQELLAALARVGIQPYDPKGAVFDPTEHEAMAQQPVEGAPSGTVVETYQQGYRQNGTILRPARVVVAA